MQIYWSNDKIRKIRKLYVYKFQDIYDLLKTVLSLTFKLSNELLKTVLLVTIY